MDNRTITEQGHAALPHIITTLAQAFQDDPSFTWLIPDAAVRRVRLTAFFKLVANEDLAAGKALLSPGGEVVTLWRAPGRQKEMPLGTLRTNLTFLTIFRSAILRADTLGKALAVHHPRGKHWHLRYIGVKPEAQGKGWGGLALGAGIDMAAADGLPIYLETSKDSNVQLYRRYGFEVIEEWDVPGGGPHFWSMMRGA
jgi:GNAT superfamily N-acetyltransferase